MRVDQLRVVVDMQPELALDQGRVDALDRCVRVKEDALSAPHGNDGRLKVAIRWTEDREATLIAFG
jgi:hypothetical protein